MLTVLIVDDSRLARTAIKKVTNQATMNMVNILEAENGKQAIEIMETQEVHVAFADINMPVMDGAAMVRAMRASGMLDRVPVVIVTSEDSDARLEEMKAEGVSAYLHKPFHATDVRNVLQQVLCEENKAQFFSDKTSPSIAPRKDLRQSFLALLTDVVGRFSFGFVEPADSALALAQVDEYLSASMTFACPSPGSFTLAAPTSLCRILAHNILKIPHESIGQTEAEDALRELLNITCGRAIAALFGGHDQVDLGIPSSGPIDDWAWESLANSPQTFVYAVEDKPLLLKFVAEEM